MDLRRRALRDSGLSAQAKVLLGLMVEWTYTEPRYDADDEIPCPWSRYALWTGAAKEDTVYAWFVEAERAGYLKRGPLRGCPPIRHFLFVLKSPENRVINSPVERGIESPAKRGNVSPADRGPHISNPFRKELSPRESIGSLRSKDGEGKEGIGSLRSTEEGGESSSLRSKEGKADGEILAGLFSMMKQAAGTEGKGEALKVAQSGRLPAKAKPAGVRKPQKGKG